jgi:hypothetical protein
VSEGEKTDLFHVVPSPFAPGLGPGFHADIGRMEPASHSKSGNLPIVRHAERLAAVVGAAFHCGIDMIIKR